MSQSPFAILASVLAAGASRVEAAQLRDGTARGLRGQQKRKPSKQPSDPRKLRVSTWAFAATGPQTARRQVAVSKQATKRCLRSASNRKALLPSMHLHAVPLPY